MMRVKREGQSRARGNPAYGGRRGGESGEGAGSSKKMDNAERRALRSKYRELQSDVAERKGTFAQVDVEVFKGLVENVDSLHKHADKTREQITDAELLNDMTTEIHDVAKCARMKGAMSVAEFVGAIIHQFGLPNEKDGDCQRKVDWEAFGLECCSVIRDCAGMSTMVGPMDVHLKPRKAVVSRKRERLSEMTRPEAVEEADDDSSNMETDGNMATMFRNLSEHGRIETARLVLNRSSFAQTVENIFALSFLVKDGRVEMVFSEDGSEFVVPRNAPSHTERTEGEVVNSQYAMTFNSRSWREMMEIVPEGKEVMPHRVKADAAAGEQRAARTPIRKNSRNRARETPATAPRATLFEES